MNGKRMKFCNRTSQTFFYSIAYASSLRISIGSDSRTCDQKAETPEVRVGKKKKRTKIKSAVSDVSEKENRKNVEKPKKKKIRFNILFSLAHL